MKKLTIEEMKRISLDEFHHSRKIPLVIVLDNVRSLYNVGSVFRTADAFRVEKIYLCGITGYPPSVEIHKTALGAEDSVEWEHCKNTLDAVTKLREQGYKIISVEQVHNSTKLNDWKICEDEKYALVLGHEVFGVNQEVVDMSDECVEIPQYGTKHSLNISCSASIVMWSFFNMYAGQSGLFNK